MTNNPNPKAASPAGVSPSPSAQAATGTTTAVRTMAASTVEVSDMTALMRVLENHAGLVDWHVGSLCGRVPYSTSARPSVRQRRTTVER